jgi:hypothetical protein
MSKKRDYGSGAIEQRGDSLRLRYRIGGKVFRKTVKGSKSEATKALRQLLHAGDTKQHVASHKMTLRQWCEHWLRSVPLAASIVGRSDSARWSDTKRCCAFMSCRN